MKTKLMNYISVFICVFISIGSYAQDVTRTLKKEDCESYKELLEMVIRASLEKDLVHTSKKRVFVKIKPHLAIQKDEMPKRVDSMKVRRLKLNSKKKADIVIHTLAAEEANQSIVSIKFNTRGPRAVWHRIWVRFYCDDSWQMMGMHHESVVD